MADLLTSYFWQAISDHAAVKWREKRSRTVVASTFTGPIGFVTWGPLRAVDLQVRITALSLPRDDQPKWYQEQPPTHDEIRRRYNSAEFRRLRERSKLADAEFIARELESGRHFEARQPGESTDKFYERVAAFYKEAIVATGKPTQTLTLAANVPRATAGRWVHEARKRGFLPKAVRGRATG